MCALKWYIKSLYRHIFLKDISKHARVTHFLISGKPNSHAHWPTCTKLGTNVAKGNNCNMTEVKKIPVNPPWDIELRRGGTTEFAGICRQIPWSRLFSTLYLRGGSPWNFFTSVILQLLPLATFVPSLVQVGQCAWELGLPEIRKWVTLACLDISFKKMCLYRLFIYHFKAHTISNKLV